MSNLSFSKRTAANRTELEKVDYGMYADKLEVIAKSEPNKTSNYYTDRKAEIEIKWIEGSIDPDQNYVWHANMPLPHWQCRDLFEAAKKMPSKSVRYLIFPDYELNADEEALFEVIFEYGRAKGLEVVAGELYIGATAGDPRAVKMYLELMELIGTEDTEDDRVKKLMRILLDI